MFEINTHKLQFLIVSNTVDLSMFDGLLVFFNKNFDENSVCSIM